MIKICDLEPLTATNPEQGMPKPNGMQVSLDLEVLVEEIQRTSPPPLGLQTTESDHISEPV